jgi:hypothetical protein
LDGSVEWVLNTGYYFLTKDGVGENRIFWHERWAFGFIWLDTNGLGAFSEIRYDYLGVHLFDSWGAGPCIIREVLEKK